MVRCCSKTHGATLWFRRDPSELLPRPCQVEVQGQRFSRKSKATLVVNFSLFSKFQKVSICSCTLNLNFSFALAFIALFLISSESRDSYLSLNQFKLLATNFCPRQFHYPCDLNPMATITHKIVLFFIHQIVSPHYGLMSTFPSAVVKLTVNAHKNCLHRKSTQNLGLLHYLAPMWQRQLVLLYHSLNQSNYVGEILKMCRQVFNINTCQIQEKSLHAYQKKKRRRTTNPGQKLSHRKATVCQASYHFYLNSRMNLHAQILRK